MFDLPPELKCHILWYLFVNEGFDAYYTLLEHAEIGELLRCNFNQQFELIRRHHPLATQLQQILTTTALLSSHKPHSSRQLAEFLRQSLLAEGQSVSFDSAKQAVSVVHTYRDCLHDANTIIEQYAKIILGNAVAGRFAYEQHPRYGTDTLSEIEHHRILRAFFRLQLYRRIRELYGTGRNFKRRIRALFSLWTAWEFDEVRSVAEWIILEYPNLPEHYAEGIQNLFATVYTYFGLDMNPYVRNRPAPARDRHRHSKFAKRSKKWDDTPFNPHEGRADVRNKDWRPLGYDRGCYQEYTQRVYREFFLAGGYPFWGRYTKPDGWWRYRNHSSDLMLQFGECYANKDI
ncbi:uncharacterized protein K460DRAFT_317928 [Cucurbitaria berberidis CBS 394.84]|uniref:Uncharacterized protein n=1 Tax=Cucurbitaria berberidis CBS 394.84 TaxID=1168544 RepID=A0A9P4GF32_9PLEO|nr:uncharacterized protein K460DRAFT_317928 [Cucurbitaria berberidis CBS 394.84]KAF1844395.1 hypothetical protein K460DRAFT_317928 [Cucurbitaria berberidis CBS 394.84]